MEKSNEQIEKFESNIDVYHWSDASPCFDEVSNKSEMTATKTMPFLRRHQKIGYF